MSDQALLFLRNYFPKLSGFAPYPWQEQLFLQIVNGSWPASVPAPTGSGKTAVMYVWALAYAWSRIHPESKLSVPRRLVWVVNNRVVVDQSTDEAKRLSESLLQLPQDDPVRAELQNLVFSPLRGQRAENREWRHDPTRPAIIVGTVDLIGSNLLFRGYRERRYWRPAAAALLAVDALIVNDEAHLTPAFRQLLSKIETIGPASQIPAKTFRVLFLTATERGPSATRLFSHDFHTDAAKNSHFGQIFNAEKALRIIDIDERKIDAEMFQAAIAEPHAPRTIIFVERPERALQLAQKIEKEVGSHRVELLTGTMRGFERDQLVETKDTRAYGAFTNKEPPAEPVFLVATAAAEVGANITSARLITALVPSERLAQRFGRLNRFGTDEGAEAILLAGKAPDPELQETLTYLESLPMLKNGLRDISCSALMNDPAPPSSMTPLPATVDLNGLESRLLDLWAQTTYPDRHVPEVKKWLHGKQEEDAWTEVAWREHTGLLAAAIDKGYRERVEEVFDKYRVLPHERLREPSYRVAEKLARIAANWKPSETADGEGRDATILMIGTDGEVKFATLQTLAARAEDDPGAVAYRLLILPPECGAVSRGMFQVEGDAGSDVSRTRLIRRKCELSETLDVEPDPEYGKPIAVPAAFENESPARWLLYYPALSEGAGYVRTEVELEDHTNRVLKWARHFTTALQLDFLSSDFEDAAQQHDRGKDSNTWRLAMRVPRAVALAKTKWQGNPALLRGFRHEFESMLRAIGASELAKYLIAVHHGYGRPFFESKQLGNGSELPFSGGPRIGLKEREKAAREHTLRFGVLQKRFGPWGLAYLETVFKAADGRASEEDKETKK